IARKRFALESWVFFESEYCAEVQLLPLVVHRTTESGAEMAHCCALMQATPVPFVNPEDCRKSVHERPPSVLLRSIGTVSPPVAKQVVVGQSTAASRSDTGDDIMLQLAPPSSERSIVPWSPTATHVVAVAQLTPRSV